MTNFKFPSIKKQYDGIPLTGDAIYVYEKIDGANVSIRKNGFRIVPWSRSRPINKSNKYYFNQFREFCFGIAMPEILELPVENILFGEFTSNGEGHINYGRDNTNQFYVIGLFDTNNQQFLEPSRINQMLTETGLAAKVRRAPLLAREIDEDMARSLLMKSALYPGAPEGIVVHEYDQTAELGIKMHKLYHPEFQELDHTKEGIEQYLTFRRMVKAGQGLLSKHQDVTIDGIIEGVIDDIRKEIQTAKEIKEAGSAMNRKRGYIQEKILPLFHK